MRLRLTSRRGRLAAFFLLYVSEGIPFGFTAVTMTAYLRRHGVGLEAIGLFAASLYAPWGFKWAWAPLIDLVRFDRFGTSRAWIVFAQSMMILTIGVVLFFDPAAQLPLVTTLIIVHNVFAATQDIAIDALAVRVLPEDEVGTANGLMFAAAYLGQAIGGSGALFIAGKLGYDAAFIFMLASLTVLLFAVSLPLLEPPMPIAASAPSEAARGSVLSQAFDRIRAFLRELHVSFFHAGRGPLIGVVLAILPQGAVALGLALATTIPVDLGMSEERIALLSLCSSIAAAFGCVVGGWVSDRVGHRASLAVWYAMTAIPTLFLAWRLTGGTGVEGVTANLYFAIAVAWSVASGLQYGTGNAVFMTLSSKTVAATQFTGYMALKNIALTYSNLWQGRVASLHGYSRALLLDGLFAIVPILVLPFVGAARRQVPAKESSS